MNGTRSSGSWSNAQNWDDPAYNKYPYPHIEWERVANGISADSSFSCSGSGLSSSQIEGFVKSIAQNTKRNEKSRTSTSSSNIRSLLRESSANVCAVWQAAYKEGTAGKRLEGISPIMLALVGEDMSFGLLAESLVSLAVLLALVFVLFMFFSKPRKK